MRIMVVDDSEIIRIKIAEVLQGENFEIVGRRVMVSRPLNNFKNIVQILLPSILRCL